MEVVDILLVDMVDKLDASGSKSHHQVADFWRAQSSMSLDGIELTCMVCVELVDILPLVQRFENVEPGSGECHR